MEPKKLLLINILIATCSFVSLYIFDSPIELIGAAGVAWVWISTVEAIRKLRKPTSFSQG